MFTENNKLGINMFKFSEIHDWQGDAAVKQILVFSSEEMKSLFEREMEDRFDKAMENVPYDLADARYPIYIARLKNELSDSRAGAIYKLRAVKNSSGAWLAIIRCGDTGKHLWEDYKQYSTPKEALSVTISYLKKSIIESWFKLD